MQPITIIAVATMARLSACRCKLLIQTEANPVKSTNDDHIPFHVAQILQRRHLTQTGWTLKLTAKTVLRNLAKEHQSSQSALMSGCIIQGLTSCKLTKWCKIEAIANYEQQNTALPLPVLSAAQMVQVKANLGKQQFIRTAQVPPDLIGRLLLSNAADRLLWPSFMTFCRDDHAACL